MEKQWKEREAGKKKLCVWENRQVRGEARTLEFMDGPTPKPEIQVPLNFENK